MTRRATWFIAIPVLFDKLSNCSTVHSNVIIDNLYIQAISSKVFQNAAIVYEHCFVKKELPKSDARIRVFLYTLEYTNDDA